MIANQTDNNIHCHYTSYLDYGGILIMVTHYVESIFFSIHVLLNIPPHKCCKGHEKNYAGGNL